MSANPPRCKSVSTKNPAPVDIHVGARIRLRRTLLGLSQMELGTAINLAFQQVQKYERGRNRVAASVLHRIAGALDVPIGFFFDDLPDGLALPASGRDDNLTRRESLELMRHYYSIPTELRRRVHELIKAMARHDV